MLERFQRCLSDGTLCDAALRLARQVPDLRSTLAALPLTPIQRALAGLEDRASDSGPLADRVRVAIAQLDSGSLSVSVAAPLEKAAEGDVTWWVPAARLHALTSPDRERAGRMALSDQNLPYVFPGELHPLQIDLFAVGDRVLPALHVDWVRKLTALVAQAIELDCKAVGMWSHPLLGILDERPIVRSLGRIRRARRIPPGGRGLAAVYLDELGQPSEKMLEGSTPADALIFDLSRAARKARR